VNEVLGPQEIEFLRRVVSARAGILIDDEKSYVFDTRLLRLLGREPLLSREIATLPELVARMKEEIVDVERDARSDRVPLTAAVVEALLNGETLFFRDAPLFHSLRTEVFPSIIAARSDRRMLSMWSAACSTGQEPYSVAMLLDDAFPELATWATLIYATDLSRAALARAEKGLYSQFEVQRGLPARLLVRCFDQTERGWQLMPRLRRSVLFSSQNLMALNDLTGPFDVIFLRNVLIYFDRRTRQRVLSDVLARLARDGVLVVGAAEPLLDDPRLKRFSATAQLCYRRA